jgi:hypothetical protein
MALACDLAPATAGAAARAPAPGTVATAGTFTGFLNDVDCLAVADCWAFGQDSAGHAVAEHWTGSAWAMVPVASPAGARTTYLPSVSCVGGTDCWAVGQYQRSTGSMVAYAEHWNGTAWSPVAVPVPSGAVVSLLIAVSCASTASCWAVGTGIPTTFMERWNGHAWTDVLSPGLGSMANPERVSCPTATDCWLSGMHGNGPTSGTLIGHWTGGAWAAVRTPTSHLPADGLLGISCQPTACMTAGMVRNAHPLAQRWNGSAWTVTPTGTVRAVLYGVSCAKPGNCMAVGGTNGGNGRVFTEQWTGARWHVVPAPSPRGGTSSLVGVSCVSATDCWGADSYFNGLSGRSLIEHWNGAHWSIPG